VTEFLYAASVLVSFCRWFLRQNTPQKNTEFCQQGFGTNDQSKNERTDETVTQKEYVSVKSTEHKMNDSFVCPIKCAR